MYLAFAWSIWWYGGTLGQRTMVQAYPVLIFAFAGFVDWVLRMPKIIQWATWIVMGGCVYLNFWFTHYAHQGQAVFPGQMTKAYYWRTVGRIDIPEETQKLMDTDELYEGGNRRNIVPLYSELNDTTSVLNKNNQYSPRFNFPYTGGADWLRFSADFKITWKEWEYWKMTQFIIRFKDKDKLVKERMIRLHRYLWEHNQRNLYFDVKEPKEFFNQVTIFFWNADSEKEITIYNLKAESFDE